MITSYKMFLESRITESVEAYHGSPIDFKSFSADKIDSGIGATFCGWGVYFTSSKSMAKSYASTSEELAEVTIDGIEPSSNFYHQQQNYTGLNPKCC